jgi:hypothetical protein
VKCLWPAFGVFCATLALVPIGLRAEVRSEFDESSQCWEISNRLAALKICLTPQGKPEFQGVRNLSTGSRWDVPGWNSINSQISVAALPEDFQGQAFELSSHGLEDLPKGGLRQEIVLRDLHRPNFYVLDLEIYDGHPVVRYRTRYVSQEPERLFVQNLDLLPWRFDAGDRTYRVLRLNQWVDAGTRGNFEPLDSILTPGGEPVVVFSGSDGQHMGWAAIRDDFSRGLFAGWEFDGRLEAAISHSSAGVLHLRTDVSDMNHPLDTGGMFRSPWAFIGVFQGDWGEAGYLTQRFAAEILAPRPPDRSVPLVAWNSWGFDQDLDEATVRRNIRLAADLGVEVVVVDLGWARHIGDWHADPRKFPSGLRAVSDYARSLGLKFGLHYAFPRVASGAPIYSERPEWLASDTVDYYQSYSLCLSHRPVRDWLLAESLRIIDEFGVDYLLQDDKNLVKRCFRFDHTHDPGDSNFSNAVAGLNGLIARIRRARPEVVIEHCASGGDMMTFNMIRLYDTAIAADSTTSLASRQSVFGLSHVFPLTYSVRYMTEHNFTTLDTRSHMFGGPWVLMQRLTDLSPGNLELLRGEIEVYKRLRNSYPHARVYHLTPRPDDARIDAIQAHDPRDGSGFALISRPLAAGPAFRLRPRGLDPAASYEVRFQNTGRRLRISGSRLMADGVTVSLPEPGTAEIVYYSPN